jgi:hypothetical protein
MSQTHTTAEVAKHRDDANGYWLIVENDVYDVTSEHTLVQERIFVSDLLLSSACRMRPRRTTVMSRAKSCHVRLCATY